MTRIDASAFLASQRQEPLTAAEQAAADGREAEYARDVPRACACIWQWRARARRYVMIGRAASCLWHDGEGSA